MSLTPKWRFEKSLVEDAPEFKGVYVLWQDDRPLAVGHALGPADTIRSRLLAHLSHAESPGMSNITHYSWEICIDPRKREAELSKALGLQSRNSPETQADDR